MQSWKPKINIGVDVLSLQLSPEQGYLLAYIDGESTVTELGALTDMSDEEVLGHLRALAQLGVVDAEQDAASPLPGPPMAGDWPDIDGVLDKVCEELAELRDSADQEAQSQELGDLLFSLANVARWLHVDAESALRGTCDRFIQRYTMMEQDARSRGLDLASLALEEQDALWDHAKRYG